MNKNSLIWKMFLLFTCIAAALMPAISFAEGSGAPEWADVQLNEKGFLNEGEYVLEDAENGRWMYVNTTLRVQIIRTWETPEKVKKSDAAQSFFCYTAEIWCDTAAGETPVTLWSDPENPRARNTQKFVKDIAADQHSVFATSTDYYTYRLDKKKKNGGPVGIVIRNGEILYDSPVKNREKSMPNYETLALFADGHVESHPNTEKTGKQYLSEGALQVYTFGPCLIRNGEITEFVEKHANRVLNPRHAFGMVESGHYIDVVCEGRLKKTNGSTGVMMETLAQIMKDRGCSIAVNLDGGQTAVMAFMGKQLNMVQKSDPNGRATFEVLSFGKYQ